MVRTSYAMSWALCVAVAEAFLPMPGRLGLRTTPPVGIGLAGTVLRKPRAVLRMSDDHDDAVKRRVEAIMEVTSLQLVVSYFEHAFLSEPATRPADVLEASLAAPTVENPKDPIPGDGEAAETQDGEYATDESVQAHVALPPAVQPVEQPAKPDECSQEDSASPSLSEDARGVLERAQAMADVMGDDVAPVAPVPPSEDAADVLARVDMMMDLHDEEAEHEHTRE